MADDVSNIVNAFNSKREQQRIRRQNGDRFILGEEIPFSSIMSPRSIEKTSKLKVRENRKQIQ